jgi:hypothetical protein
VSGIGVAVLVLLAAIFRVVPDTPAGPADAQEHRRFERTALTERHDSG